MVRGAQRWVEAAHGGNIAQAGRVVGLDRSWIADLKRSEPKLMTLRALAAQIPDVVAEAVGVSRAARPRRGTFWPNLQKAVQMTRVDGETLAYAKALNDLWARDREPLEWAKELTAHAVAHFDETETERRL
jgi:hypothetical protein